VTRRDRGLRGCGYKSHSVGPVLLGRCARSPCTIHKYYLQLNLDTQACVNSVRTIAGDITPRTTPGRAVVTSCACFRFVGVDTAAFELPNKSCESYDLGFCTGPQRMVPERDTAAKFSRHTCRGEGNRRDFCIAVTHTVATMCTQFGVPRRVRVRGFQVPGDVPRRGARACCLCALRASERRASPQPEPSHANAPACLVLLTRPHSLLLRGRRCCNGRTSCEPTGS
jgi:hypothetical protein